MECWWCLVKHLKNLSKNDRDGLMIIDGEIKLISAEEVDEQSMALTEIDTFAVRLRPSNVTMSVFARKEIQYSHLYLYYIHVNERTYHINLLMSHLPSPVFGPLSEVIQFPIFVIQSQLSKKRKCSCWMYLPRACTCSCLLPTTLLNPPIPHE